MNQDIRRIYYYLFRNRAEARAAYKEAFGVSHEDPSIDEKLEQIFCASRSDTVTLPKQLALAFLLRPRRGGGRKRPPKELLAKFQEERAIEEASIRWAELGGPSASWTI